MNLSVGASLKIREKYKYVLLEEFLNKSKVQYEFEFTLGNYVFDLLLFEEKIFIEFDSSYHNTMRQKKIDVKKEELATKNGFHVIRRRVGVGEIIDPFVLLGVV